MLAVIGSASGDVEYAEQTLPVGREGGDQLVGNHHGAEATHVVHAAGGVDQHEAITAGPEVEQRVDNPRRALVQRRPSEAADGGDIAAVEAARFE